MNHDTIDATPRRMNWAEGYDGDGFHAGAGTWHSWASQVCENDDSDTGKRCGAIVATGGTCGKCGKDNDSDASPAMNSFYPLGSYAMDKYNSTSPEDMALKLAYLPLCLVRINGGEHSEDEWGLALTGGGMDLSWEICAAYVALDFVPPAHFARNLPAFSGMRLTASKRRILSACRESLRCQRDWNARGLQRMRDLSKTMRADALRPFTLQLDKDNFWTIRKDGKLLRRVPADSENGGLNFYRHRNDALTAVKTLKKGGR